MIGNEEEDVTYPEFHLLADEMDRWGSRQTVE